MNGQVLGKSWDRAWGVFRYSGLRTANPVRNESEEFRPFHRPEPPTAGGPRRLSALCSEWQAPSWPRVSKISRAVASSANSPAITVIKAVRRCYSGPRQGCLPPINAPSSGLNASSGTTRLQPTRIQLQQQLIRVPSGTGLGNGKSGRKKGCSPAILRKRTGLTATRAPLQEHEPIHQLGTPRPRLRRRG